MNPKNIIPSQRMIFPEYAQWKLNQLYLKIRVQPRSKTKNFPTWVKIEDHLKVWIAQPPIEGKANAALCRHLCQIFKCAFTQCQVIQGLKSKKKIVSIACSFQKAEAIISQIALEIEKQNRARSVLELKERD